MTTLASIIKALRKPTTAQRTSADLRADLDKIDLSALEAEVEAAEMRRRKLLLAGTDAEVEAATRDLAAANLALERARIAIEEIGKLIAAAQEREAVASVEAKHAAAVAAADRLAQADRELDNLADQLVTMLSAADADAARVADWNRIAHQSGRPHLRAMDPALKRPALAGRLQQARARA